jgi:hypothetical protein
MALDLQHELDALEDVAAALKRNLPELVRRTPQATDTFVVELREAAKDLQALDSEMRVG